VGKSFPERLTSAQLFTKIEAYGTARWALLPKGGRFPSDKRENETLLDGGFYCHAKEGTAVRGESQEGL
jgi:hypothetical protein